MYNYSKAKIKISLEIDKIMKKLENTYQDASLIKKALLGDASDEEQLVLEQRLSEHPELKTVYEKLQTLLISIKNIHRKRLTSISFNKFNKKKIRLTERYVVSGRGGMLLRLW